MKFKTTEPLPFVTLTFCRVVVEHGSVIKIGIDIADLVKLLFAVPPELTEVVSVIVTVSDTL
jgi:hypothetical protein